MEYFLFHSFFGTKKMSEKKINTFLSAPLPISTRKSREQQKKKKEKMKKPPPSHFLPFLNKKMRKEEGKNAIFSVSFPNKKEKWK